MMHHPNFKCWIFSTFYLVVLIVLSCQKKNILDQVNIKIQAFWDVPGSPVVKNRPCNAGDVGSIPGQGARIPHAVEQLSLRVHYEDPLCRN